MITDQSLVRNRSETYKAKIPVISWYFRGYFLQEVIDAVGV